MIVARQRLCGLAVALALSGSLAALAQGRGGGGPGGGGMGGGGGGMPRGTFGGGNTPYSNFPSGPRSRGTSGGSGSSSDDGSPAVRLELGPPGRWWDNGRFAQSIGLDARQQHRMDDIFGENKGTLVKLYKNLQHEESQLSKTVRARELDEATIFQQIDRVAQARGDLEKANAHMLLQIRKEMTPEQTARLDDRRPDM